MSESNKPRGGKPVVQTDCRRAVDILIDELGDTTRRPRRPNVPLESPPRAGPNPIRRTSRRGRRERVGEKGGGGRNPPGGGDSSRECEVTCRG